VNVGEYNGDMNINCWDISRWNRELTQNQVIVMTPQIFLNMLNKSFINFSQINLLIVDECHWAARKEGKRESGHQYKQVGENDIFINSNV
jgi:endoribonuclease Dicer